MKMSPMFRTFGAEFPSTCWGVKLVFDDRASLRSRIIAAVVDPISKERFEADLVILDTKMGGFCDKRGRCQSIALISRWSA